MIDCNCGWQAVTNGGSEVFVVPAHDGAYAYVNDDRCGNGADMSDVWMKLPVMDFSGIGYPELSFDNLRKTATETFTVKISTDGGNTWTDEAVYTNNTNKWQTETVNLTAYAGRPDVRIAFHYNDGGKWGYGWAVDNIKVRTPKTIPYSTEFDNSMDDWKGVTITGTDNWKWSNDQAYNYIRFKSSSKANGYAMFDLIRNGEGGSNPSETALVSPLFDFSSVASSSFIAMSFEHAARGYATSTTLRVQASTDDFVGDIRTVWTTTIPSQTYASGYPQFVDLSAFAGEPTVRLRFLYSGGRAYGWLIDDINIREVTTIDVAIADADSEHTISREGDGVTLKAIVRNHGILASNIPVQFSVNGQNFMATVPLLSIGDTATVTVTWPNSTAGVHDINVTLPNDSDNSNNSLSFKKVVATTTQLTEGFERTIFPPHGWTNESGLWTQDTYASSVYEGTKYATIGGNNITFTNAKLITPKLNIAAGDKFVFYGEYYGTPASAPTVQIMYSGDKTNWLPVRTPLTMTDEYGLYVVDLNITGTYYLAIGATGTNCYVDIDHVIAPVPVTGALTFVVLDENNRPVNNATITLNETTNPAGNYSFTDLIYETYNYRVSSDRYADVSGTITIATGSTTKSVTLRSCPVISSFPWTEDFENGMSECFKLIDGDCGWQVGTDGGGGGFNIPAHDGAYAYANDDRCGNSKNMNDVWMKLLIMDFTELISPELMFDNYRRWDRCVIKVSTDGSTWTDEAVYTGILSLWRTETVDLSAYAGQPAVYVAFRYSDGGSWGYGWAVDNITVKEKDSFDATLSSLSVAGHVISPVFDPYITDYTLNVPYSVDEVEINATVAQSAANIVTGTGTTALIVGTNTCDIVVLAPDGITSKTYTVAITRAAPSGDATLSEITLSTGLLNPLFGPTTTAYTVNLEYSVQHISVTGTANHIAATVVGNGFYPLSIGDNIITLTVTAENGTTQTYKITVVRDVTPSNDATLKSLILSEGTLDPVFNPDTTAYTVDVAYVITNIIVTGTKNHDKATVAGNASYPLSIGGNFISITVTAEDGTIRTYAITVVRAAPSDDATLNTLTVNPGTLEPAFNSSTKDYTVEVANNVTSVSVNYTTNHANARVVVTGTPGNLSVGDNLVSVTVTAEDGTTLETYTVRIKRAPSDDATLNALTANPGTLDPAFNSSTKDYAVEVANNVTSVSVNYTTNHTNARVAVTGTPGNLSVGDNLVTLAVTAEDGTTIETYTVTINRAPSDDASLNALTINPGTLEPAFNSSTKDYAVEVANNVTSVNVIYTTNHANARVVVTGTSGNLSVGDNFVTLTVTAEDGTTIEIYTIRINRAPSDDATLRALTVSAGTLVFDPATTEYTVDVANEVRNISVGGTATHENANVAGRVTDEPLAVGNNVVTLTVTAEDRTTIKTYTVTINRAPSNEADLVEISVNDNEIYVDELVYQANCGEVSVILALKISEAANVKVNGSAYGGGAIPLSGDVTNITISVIPESGASEFTNNFTLKVVSAFSDNRLYHQRWDDVLAVNMNPAENGSRNITAVRWYDNQGFLVGTGEYIALSGLVNPNDYHAEIEINGNRHIVCHSSGTRVASRVFAFPNPVPQGESLTLELTKAYIDGTLNIYTVSGGMVKQNIRLYSNTVSVSAEGLEKGIYLFIVTAKTGETQTVKIIIN